MSLTVIFAQMYGISEDWKEYVGIYREHAKKLAKEAEYVTQHSFLQFGKVKAIFKATKERVIIVIGEDKYEGIIFKPRDGVIESADYSRYDGETANAASYTATTLGTSGGWEEGITKKENNVAIFSMTEASKLNFLLSGEIAITEGNFVSECEYGNLYWTADVNDEVFTLSWKGTPTRHFPLDCYTNIPNFSTYLGEHEKQTGSVSRFSAFDKYIYINCSKVESPPFTFPFYSASENMVSTANTSLASCIVLGASIDPITNTILIVCLSEFFNGATGIATLSDGRLLKLDEALTEVSKNRSLTITNRLSAPTMDSRWITYWSYGGPYNGWSFIGQTDVPEDELYPDYAWSTHEYPWFADELGTTFTSSKGAKTQFVYNEVTAKYSINKLKDKDVVLDVKLSEDVVYETVGEASELVRQPLDIEVTLKTEPLDRYTSQGVKLQVDYTTSGSYDLFFEPKGNSSVNYSFTATTDETGLRGITKVYGPLLKVKTIAPPVAQISVYNSNSNTLFVGMQFLVGGLVAPYTIATTGVTFRAITSNKAPEESTIFEITAIGPSACGLLQITASGSCPEATGTSGSGGVEAVLQMLGPIGNWVAVSEFPYLAFTLSLDKLNWMDAMKAAAPDTFFGEGMVFAEYKYKRIATTSIPTATTKYFWDNLYGQWCDGACWKSQGDQTGYDWTLWDKGTSDILPGVRQGSSYTCKLDGEDWWYNGPGSFVSGTQPLYTCDQLSPTLPTKPATLARWYISYGPGITWYDILKIDQGVYTGQVYVVATYKYVCP